MSERKFIGRGYKIVDEDGHIIEIVLGDRKMAEIFLEAINRHENIYHIDGKSIPIYSDRFVFGEHNV